MTLRKFLLGKPGNIDEFLDQAYIENVNSLNLHVDISILEKVEFFRSGWPFCGRGRLFIESKVNKNNLLRGGFIEGITEEIFYELKDLTENFSNKLLYRGTKKRKLVIARTNLIYKKYNCRSVSSEVKAKTDVISEVEEELMPVVQRAYEEIINDGFDVSLSSELSGFEGIRGYQFPFDGYLNLLDKSLLK